MLNLTHTLDFTTACTIGTSLVHSKLDYCKLTNWIVFNQSKTVLHEQSVELLNFPTLHIAEPLTFRAAPPPLAC
mgnify:FL=1